MKTTKGLFRILTIGLVLVIGLGLLLLPAFSRARSRAERINCVRNLRDMGFVLHGDSGSINPRCPSGTMYFVCDPSKEDASSPETILAYCAKHRTALLSDGSVRVYSEADFESRIPSQLRNTNDVAAVSSKTSSKPTATGGESGPSLGKKLVGSYECSTPAWALQLNSDGSYVMEARESGNSFRGTWSASGSSGLLDGTYPSKATMTFTVQGDGAIVVDKYGYTFVRTR